MIERVFWLPMGHRDVCRPGPLADSVVENVRYRLILHGKVQEFLSAHVQRVQDLVVRVGSRLLELREEPPDGRSPTVTWQHDGPSTPLTDLRVIALGNALIRGDITGRSGDDAVYDVFWSALRRSEDLRRWVESESSDWYSFVRDALDRTD